MCSSQCRILVSELVYESLLETTDSFMAMLVDSIAFLLSRPFKANESVNDLLRHYMTNQIGGGVQL